MLILYKNWSKFRSRLLILFVGALLLSIVSHFLPKNINSIQQLSQLQQQNIEVTSHWEKTGKGYSPLKDINIHLEDFLNYPDASCSQQSYLFARKASQQGFLARRVGLWASDGANDVMVEVRVNGKWYLFVPTAGVYYRFSLADIFNSPDKSLDYRGDPKPGTEMYLKQEFFSNIYKVDIYPSLNNTEFNYAALAKVNSKNLFPSPNSGESAVDNDLITYAAGKHNLFPQIIELSWKEPIEIYRLFIQWYSSEDYGSDYDIMLHNLETNSTEKYHIRHNEFNQYGDYSQISLPEMVVTDSVKIIFNKAHGQPRLLIKEIKVY